MPQHIVHTIMRDIYLTVMLVRQEDTMRGIHLTVVLVKQEDIMQGIALVKAMVVLPIVIVGIIPVLSMVALPTATMRHIINVHHTQCTMRNIINVHHTQYIIQHPQHILLQDIVLLLMVQKHTVHILNPTNNMQQCIKKLVEEQFQKIHA